MFVVLGPLHCHSKMFFLWKQLAFLKIGALSFWKRVKTQLTANFLKCWYLYLRNSLWRDHATSHMLLTAIKKNYIHFLEILSGITHQICWKLINKKLTNLKNYCELSFYQIFEILAPKSLEKASNFHILKNIF